MQIISRLSIVLILFNSLVFSYSWQKLTTAASQANTVAVSASSEYGIGYEAWRAFDSVLTSSGNQNELWRNDGSANGWIKVDFGAPFVSTSYSLTGRVDTILANPSNWTFEGSNNNSTWDILDTRNSQANVISSSSSGTTYNFVNSTSYRYYRLNITGTGGAYIGLPQVRINDSSGINKVPVLNSYRGLGV